jgi:hypothetical protein
MLRTIEDCGCEFDFHTGDAVDVCSVHEAAVFHHAIIVEDEDKRPWLIYYKERRRYMWAIEDIDLAMTADVTMDITEDLPFEDVVRWLNNDDDQ